jgi:hypothetical protein
MSSLSEQDHLNPNDPSYYAPRWLRERPDSRSSLSQEARSGPLAPPASLDTQLEKAVSEALWHPLDPEVILEPPGFAREMDQQRALISVAGRFAAAVGVSAIVALFFVIMIPASRDHAQQADGAAAATPGILQSIKTALYRPGQKDDDLKPALSEFQPILASTRTGQPAITREQSEALLQQFVQWRQKPNSTEAPQ